MKVIRIFAAMTLWAGCVTASEPKRQVAEQEKKQRSSMVDAIQLHQRMQQLKISSHKQSQLVERTTDVDAKHSHAALLMKYHAELGKMRDIWVNKWIRRMFLDESVVHTDTEICRDGNHRKCTYSDKGFLAYYDSLSKKDKEKLGLGSEYPSSVWHDIWGLIRSFLIGGVPKTAGSHIVYSPLGSLLFSRQMAVGRQGAQVCEVSPNRSGTFMLISYSDGIVRQVNMQTWKRIDHNFHGKLAGYPIKSFCWQGDAVWSAHSLHPAGYGCDGNVYTGTVKTEELSVRQMRIDELDRDAFDQDEFEQEVAFIRASDSSFTAEAVSDNGRTLFNMERDDHGMNEYVINISTYGEDEQMQGVVALPHDREIASIVLNAIGSRAVLAERGGNRFLAWRQGDQELTNINIDHHDGVNSTYPVAASINPLGTRAVVLSHGKAQVIDMSDYLVKCSPVLPNREMCCSAELVGKDDDQLLTVSSRGILRFYEVNEAARCILEIQPVRAINRIATDVTQHQWRPVVQDTIRHCRGGSIGIAYDSTGWSDSICVYRFDQMKNQDLLEACTMPCSLDLLTGYGALTSMVQRAHQVKHDRRPFRVQVSEQMHRFLRSYPLGRFIGNITSHTTGQLVEYTYPMAQTRRTRTIGIKRKTIDEQSSSSTDSVKRTK